MRIERGRDATRVFEGCERKAPYWKASPFGGEKENNVRRELTGGESSTKLKKDKAGAGSKSAVAMYQKKGRGERRLVPGGRTLSPWNAFFRYEASNCCGRVNTISPDSKGNCVTLQSNKKEKLESGLWLACPISKKKEKSLKSRIGEREGGD